MGKVLSLLIGAIVTIVGLILLIAWWGDLLTVVKGIVPGILILGGLVALAAGVSEIKDTAKAKEKQ